ncbi:hypothetical protein KVP04_11400 [Halobacterium salinarum]|uniref:hypothetical protein n=1 Tax=Halobacterium salinarum TaxID=2242 RepID=UPI001F22C25D|nr:hypothetical protein [Halobacterium salinarum]MCF2164491.1 hypothetical protein [Halobacterium salinarum]MCF2167278.1 hypothetical protein [Halobacterium salinarum]MCF2239718.1 hypothetical protein [Halobacterium salinarum]
MDPNRRQLLQSIAGSTAIGIGFSQISTPGAAKETDNQNDELSITKLSDKETEKLRTELLSSNPVKTVRDKIQEEGFTAEIEEHTAAGRITNEDTGEQWSALRVGFSYAEETEANNDHAAILYVHKREDEVSVRGISQHEGESVKVHEAQGPTGYVTESNSGGVMTYTVPVVNGGES